MTNTSSAESLKNTKPVSALKQIALTALSENGLGSVDIMPRERLALS